MAYAQRILQGPHSVSLILDEQQTSHLSAARDLRYLTCLLEMSNGAMKGCNTLNPALLMLLPTDGEPYACIAELDVILSPQPDLTDLALPYSDFVFYTDGLAFQLNNGNDRVRNAIVTDSEVLRSASLTCHLSAQGTKLIALTEECKIAKGKSDTIYTDSHYVFGVAHDFVTLWKCRNYLKSVYVLNDHLLQAILLPSAVAANVQVTLTSETPFVRKLPGQTRLQE